MTELEAILSGLKHGDFSLLGPRFFGNPPPIALHFAALDAPMLAEALTCACWLGALDVARDLLARGVPARGGAMTGLDALHWAANRGQLEAVELLIAAGAPLDSLSMYGSTVLGTAIWSSENEPRPDHPAIIEALKAAGAA